MSATQLIFITVAASLSAADSPLPGNKSPLNLLCYGKNISEGKAIDKLKRLLYDMTIRSCD